MHFVRAHYTFAAFEPAESRVQFGWSAICAPYFDRWRSISQSSAMSKRRKRIGPWGTPKAAMNSGESRHSDRAKGYLQL